MEVSQVEMSVCEPVKSYLSRQYRSSFEVPGDRNGRPLTATSGSMFACGQRSTLAAPSRSAPMLFGFEQYQHADHYCGGDHCKNQPEEIAFYAGRYLGRLLN